MIEPSGSTTNSWQGRVVGNYRVLRPLGEGGMGCVFEGEHVFLERRVAIKFIRNEALTTPSVSQRFFREAQSLNALQSEHIVQVVDFGKEGDAPYLVMEFAEGRNLRDVMSDGALPPATALDIAIQVCEGLSVSHAKGIIHRDVKPDNLVLSSRSDGRRLVRILDFGIATRDPSRTPSNATFATESGTAIGSPHYMAPEQVQDASQVGARADIYALGVILFEMLSGRRPFDGSRERIFAAKLFTEPPNLAASGSRVPEALSRCVAKAMARDADARFRNIGELKAALGDCLRLLDEPSTAKAPQVRTNAIAQSGLTLNTDHSTPSGDGASTLQSAKDAAAMPSAEFRLQPTEELGTALVRAATGVDSSRASSYMPRRSSTRLFAGAALTVAMAGAWWFHVNAQRSDQTTSAPSAHAAGQALGEREPSTMGSEQLPAPAHAAAQSTASKRVETGRTRDVEARAESPRAPEVRAEALRPAFKPLRSASQRGAPPHETSTAPGANASSSAPASSALQTKRSRRPIGAFSPHPSVANPAPKQDGRTSEKSPSAARGRPPTKAAANEGSTKPYVFGSYPE